MKEFLHCNKNNDPSERPAVPLNQLSTRNWGHNIVIIIRVSRYSDLILQSARKLAQLLFSVNTRTSIVGLETEATAPFLPSIKLL